MQKINLIQGLRAIAANMVILCHLVFFEQKYGNGITILPEWFNNLSIGVDIFFWISGFIMASIITKQTKAFEFFKARVLRIYPIYWIYATLTLVAFYLTNSPIIQGFTQDEIRQSYLLTIYPGHPFLDQGWSLVFEMAFYVCLGVFIILRMNLTIAASIWLGFIVLAKNNEDFPELLLTNYRSLSFVIGLLCARFLFDFPEYAKYKIKDITPQWLVSLGDASYSIYLSHILIISAAGMLFARVNTSGLVAASVFVIGCVIACNVFGLLSYKFIEKPIATWLKPKKEKRS